MKNFDQLFRVKCTGCGTCCTDPIVPVTDADVRRLARATGLPAERIVRMYKTSEIDYELDREGWIKFRYGKRLMGLRKKDERCLFLTADKLCRAYAVRPATCRTFPLEIELGEQDQIDDLELNKGVDCKHRFGEKTLGADLVRDAKRETDEDAAYHRKLRRWNSKDRAGGKLEFLAFLGLTKTTK